MTNLSNPSLKGVYTFARYSTDYPMVLDLTYPISELDGVTGMPYMDDIEIGSICISGNDIFVSWYNHSNNACGVDKIDYNNKYPFAYIETNIQTIYRQQMATYVDVDVAYVDKPTDTNIRMQYCKDFEEEFINATELNGIPDVDRKLITFEESFESSLVFFRIWLLANENDAPSIESVIISTS